MDSLGSSDFLEETTKKLKAKDMTPFPGSEGLNSPLFSELSDLMELFLVKVVITVIIIIIDIIGS